MSRILSDCVVRVRVVRDYFETTKHQFEKLQVINEDTENEMKRINEEKLHIEIQLFAVKIKECNDVEKTIEQLTNKIIRITENNEIIDRRV